tara:strand:+ start:25370 stop:26494 length:1125 start_codon:yes stop_codon:yes gene_type:complete
MLIDAAILFLMVLSKFIKQTLLYNALYVPAVLYLFISSSSLFLFRKLTIYLLSIFFIFIFFSNYFFSSLDSSAGILLIRILSLSLFYLTLFGLLPFSHFLFNKFRLTILFSIPAIFTIMDPPWFYSYASSSTDYVSSPGLFSGFSVAGLFPTSLYFAQILSAYILYFNTFFIKDKFLLIVPLFNKVINRLLLIILLLFTNRKAFLFSFIFYPINDIILNWLKIFRNSVLKKKEFFQIIFFIISFIVIYSILFFGVRSGYGFSYILNDIVKRLQAYFVWVINPDSVTFGETGLLYAQLFGGYFLFSLTLFLFVLSFLVSLFRIGFDLKKALYFSTSYIFLGIFLFKDASTMWSPSPASLLLFMIVSFLIRKILYY